MSDPEPFSLTDFLPYLLNQAAEASSKAFQGHYRQRYGMLRTEWRVLYHLGCFGPMTAKTICGLASIHKTKVSRAVQALEEKRLLTRRTMPEDRRNETLSLTPKGHTVFADLSRAAQTHDAKLAAMLTEQEAALLRATLRKLASM